MTLYFSNYTSDTERIVARVRDTYVPSADAEKTNTIIFREHAGTIYPLAETFSLNETEWERVQTLREGDVLEIFSDGIAKVYFSASDTDYCLLITPRCNSNCIMCPSSEASRRKGTTTPLEQLLELIRYIPEDAPHVTLTGGEPFLLKRDLFVLLKALQTKLPETDFLLLTNGRALSDREYATAFLESSPQFMQVGIPLHASYAELHDAITRSAGSFEQTMAGIKRLLHSRMKVELRVVISKINAEDMLALAQLIVKELKGVYCVNFIGLEMLGNAAVNAEQVWIPYRDAFYAARPAVNLLVQNKIDVSFYNFPLCTVDAAYRNICARSISDYKVVYGEECRWCKQKERCGGMFAGTARYLNRTIKRIE